MILSDQVSSIMQQSPSDYLIHWEALPTYSDPDFLFDLHNHLKTLESYRKERKEFYKLHPGWCLFQARDEFFHQYPELFFRDIGWLVHANLNLDPEEAAQAFCSKYRGYGNVYGVEFVKRAIVREVESKVHSNDILY